MPLGNYNNNDNKKNYSPTVYSSIGYGNPQSKVDPTAMSFSYWRNLLQIKVSPRVEGGNDDKVVYDKDNAISIYLSPSKARIFADNIKTFLTDPNKYENAGVASGAGLIYISNGKEFGINNLVIKLLKLDENGAVQASIAYEFKQDYYYSIINFDEKNPTNFTKQYHNDLEIKELLSVLETFYTSATNATAYSIIENGKYDLSRVNTKLTMACEKLGITFNKGGKSSTSFFNNNGNNGNATNSNFQQGTLADIDEMMGN